MSLSRFLFFGRDQAILALMKHQITALGHSVEGFLDEPEGTARSRKGEVDLLVGGPGVEAAPRKNCRSLCNELGIGVLEHEGGHDHLGRNIATALAQRQTFWFAAGPARESWALTGEVARYLGRHRSQAYSRDRWPNDPDARATRLSPPPFLHLAPCPERDRIRHRAR